MPTPNTEINVQIKRRWYQIHFTSEKSATVFRLNPKTKSINGMGGPLFNCKTNHLSDGWFLFMIKDHTQAKSTWPLIKNHLDNLPEPKQTASDILDAILNK